ncbi:MAG: prephenate dehydrogenase [Anaerolineales bacterium]
MEDGFSLEDSVIGILGLGLMGGSLAMSLKGKCARLIGFDAHLPTVSLALAVGIVDHASSDLSSMRQLDVLILATPVNVILDILPTLPSFIKQPCILMDLGSTKKVILESMNQLPENFDVIGAHPICGKEQLGLQNADADLYRNAPFVVTPSARTTPKAISAARQIISAVGANLIEMSAEAHDLALAFTSHLPFLLASSLARSTPHEYASLIGPGFRSTSRLAGTPAHMMMGILRSNRENTLKAIQTFRAALDETETALRNEEYAVLDKMLHQSRSNHQSLISSPPR